MTDFIILAILLAAGAALAIYDNRRRAKKNAEAKAQWEKEWAVSYQNPASPNYDKARVEAEAAAAEAAMYQ